jgi:hypothetical protein
MLNAKNKERMVESILDGMGCSGCCHKGSDLRFKEIDFTELEYAKGNTNS